MDLAEYQEKARETAIYAGRGEIRGLSYITLGLVNEAGDAAGHVKKILRDDNTSRTGNPRVEKIKGELGDTLWYLAAICSELGFSLEEVAQENLDKLASRKERGVLMGDGSTR